MFNLISRFHLLQGLVVLVITGVGVFRIPADFVFIARWTGGSSDWLWPRDSVLAGGPVIAVLLLMVFAALGRLLTANHLAKVRHILEPALTLCLGVVLAVQLGWLLRGIGSDLDLIRLTGFGLGALLLVLAVVVAEAERHTYAGLRLPWPIEGDVAWRRVHRGAGIAFGLAGAGLLALAWFSPDPGPLVIGFAVALLAPVAVAGLVTLAQR